MTLHATNLRVRRELERPVTVLVRLGDQAVFFGKALAGIPFAMINYRRDIVRQIAVISMGAGTLAMIGGTVAIVGFLTLATGGTLAVQGHSSLGDIGIESLTGRPCCTALARIFSLFSPAPSSLTSITMLPPRCCADRRSRPAVALPFATRWSGDSIPWSTAARSATPWR